MNDVALVTRMHTGSQYIVGLLESAGVDFKAVHCGDSWPNSPVVARSARILITTTRDEESIKNSWKRRYGALSFRKLGNGIIHTYEDQLEEWNSYVKNNADLVIDIDSDNAVETLASVGIFADKELEGKRVNTTEEYLNARNR